MVSRCDRVMKGDLILAGRNFLGEEAFVGSGRWLEGFGR